MMETTHEGMIPHTEISGVPLRDADRVLILLHGRGSSAGVMLGLAMRLGVEDYAHLAVQAQGNTWYPYSFLAPRRQNEPWLSRSLERVDAVVEALLGMGFNRRQLFFLGFSQGACLALEYLARHGARYGGAVAFTGGLIGETVDTSLYQGDFEGMPVFIGTSDPDPHVPVQRVMGSENVLRDMGAVVKVKVYPGMGHIVSEDEVLQAGSHVLAAAARG
jgi:phospholipase/carboxylesterase